VSFIEPQGRKQVRHMNEILNSLVAVCKINKVSRTLTKPFSKTASNKRVNKLWINFRQLNLKHDNGCAVKQGASDDVILYRRLVVILGPWDYISRPHNHLFVCTRAIKTTQAQVADYDQCFGSWTVSIIHVRRRGMWALHAVSGTSLGN